jgi:hypothetical protein
MEAMPSRAYCNITANRRATAELADELRQRRTLRALFEPVLISG